MYDEDGLGGDGGTHSAVAGVAADGGTVEGWDGLVGMGGEGRGGEGKLKVESVGMTFAEICAQGDG